MGRSWANVERTGDGAKVTVEPASGGAAETLEADVVLVAIGRVPYTEGLGLKEAGVALDNRNRVQVDHHAAALHAMRRHVLHAQAARLPVDFDEDDYMRAGQILADEIRIGNPAILLEDNYRIEHPQLVKILIAAVMVGREPIQRIPELAVTANPYDLLHRPTLAAVRRMEMAFGIVAVTALALVSPVAGLLLAVSTWVIKYTSQVMLESVPLLFSLLGVALYELARGASDARRRRLAYVASALGIGLAVGHQGQRRVARGDVSVGSSCGTPKSPR